MFIDVREAEFFPCSKASVSLSVSHIASVLVMLHCVGLLGSPALDFTPFHIYFTEVNWRTFDYDFRYLEYEEYSLQSKLTRILQHTQIQFIQPATTEV